jgi:hypothetical protein
MFYRKVKKKLFCSGFFYLSSNKKWLMWYKKWKKNVRMFWIWLFWKKKEEEEEEVNWSEASQCKKKKKRANLSFYIFLIKFAFLLKLTVLSPVQLNLSVSKCNHYVDFIDLSLNSTVMSYIKLADYVVNYFIKLIVSFEIKIKVN